MGLPVDGATYLRARLGLVEQRVRTAVARRRATDAAPDDQFRGLYLTDADVDRLLAPPAAPTEPPADEVPVWGGQIAELEARADAAGLADLPLRRMVRTFGLEQADLDILLVALAPDLDPRFERLYGYLHDDVSRRRASVGLALELSGLDAVDGTARGRLGPAGALVGGHLLVVEESDRPFLTRSLRVPDRVAAHILGDDTPEMAVGEVMGDLPDAEVGDLSVIGRALASGVRLMYVRERSGTTGAAFAATALRRHGLPVVVVDLQRLSPGADIAALGAAVGREARLLGGAVVAGPVEALGDRDVVAVRCLAEAACPMVIVGTRHWDPRWSRLVPLLIDAPVPTVDQRATMWRRALNGGADGAFDAAAATVQFRLTPEQVMRAAASARQQAAALARPLDAGGLHLGARSQNAAGLERLARRVEPVVGWADLVLPSAALTQLRELAARARHRDRVLDEWGMGGGASEGRGITALFAGESGTGKTISAEVLAGELGLDLYVIDLATVVDKYIGETEKNLDRIFDEADRVNGVLLFDEADAIFGKRSEVRDAHDRYANVEVAYLLQRMERFDGIAILTSNLRSNVDEAFTRRLDAVVEFPMPDEDDRRRLWERHLRPTVPRSDGIDFDFLARSFRLAGGNVRNITLTAAFLAAEDGREVSMVDLVRATEREYRKLGRLCVEAEFGPYYGLVAGARPGGR